MFRTDEKKEKAVVTFLKWLTREEKQYPILYGIRISSGNKNCQ